MRVLTRTAMLAAAVLALGCSAEGEAEDEDGDITGTLTLRFEVSADVRNNASLTDPLKGVVYGWLFHAEDVTTTGPKDGAQAVDEITIEDVDLTTDELSAATWRSGPLEPGRYTFLGFWDLDGNGADSKQPDDGDPATDPAANVYDVGDKAQVTGRAQFSILSN